MGCSTNAAGATLIAESSPPPEVVMSNQASHPRRAAVTVALSTNSCRRSHAAHAHAHARTLPPTVVARPADGAGLAAATTLPAAQPIGERTHCLPGRGVGSNRPAARRAGVGVASRQRDRTARRGSVFSAAAHRSRAR